MADKLTRTVVLFAVACSTCCFGFHFTDCTNSSQPLLKVTHVNISRDPIHIPGDETIYAEIEVLQPIDAHTYKMDIVMEKLFLSKFREIPCIGHTGDTGNLGSCAHDLCDELSGRWVSSHCPVTAMDPHLAGYNCSCPVQPGTYRILSKTYHIPMLGKLESAFAAGDYRVKAVVTDVRSGEEVGCWQLTMTTTTDCTGPLCIFG